MSPIWYLSAIPHVHPPPKAQPDKNRKKKSTGMNLSAPGPIEKRKDGARECRHPPNPQPSLQPLSSPKPAAHTQPALRTGLISPCLALAPCIPAESSS